MATNKIDTQIVEALGKNLLVNKLLISNIEVAYPIRDRGVDLIAYNERGTHSQSFIATPLQLKIYTKTGFSIDKKYSQIKNLVLVYVWNTLSEVNAKFFALTYKEAVELATKMEWTKNASWTKDNGRWSTSKSSERLRNLIAKYEIADGDWSSIMKKGI